MGTRAAAFNAKIQNLLDYHLRLLHGVVPPPSGHDIASTLKYFSQTVLGVLKDIQAMPLEMLCHRDQDIARLALFPSLDYKGLHQALNKLVDVIPLVQFGAHAMGEALVQTICCLMPFFDRELADMIPYTVASMMTSVPESLHQNIIDSLCYNILPFTIGAPSLDDNENYAEASLPAIFMTIFQYSENSSHHSQLVECVMAFKKDVIKDLFTVIAHGTPTARPAAANLLFYYWPNLNPTLYDRRGFHIRFADISCVLKAMFNKSAMPPKSDSITQTDSGESQIPKGWKQLRCQLEDSEGEHHSEAVKLCLDHSICLSLNPEAPPPLYLCKDCASTHISQEAALNLTDILIPMSQVSASCENKNCRANEKNAVTTCFNRDCVSYNGNKPIRYCSQCNNIRHNNRRGTDHIVHMTYTSVWNLEPQSQNYVIEAIVSLLNEAQPLGDKVKGKEQERLRACLLEDENVESLTMEDRRLLSRYGVWLIVGLCTPTQETPIPLLGRLLGALCHWFSATQYLPDDQQGANIERLKSDYLHNWLQDIVKNHFDIFVSCLLPHPVDYAKVGGHWDTLATKSDHVKEGFRRLFCLVPYDLVTQQVWEKVMPYWMEAIHNEVPEKDLSDLKITLSKLLDPEMSPLGFDSTQMYSFIAARFINTDETVQEQTLSWLQLLSSLSITIPIYQLIEMFQDGVKSLLGKKTVVKKDEKGNDAPTVEPVEENHSDGEANEPGEDGKKPYDNTLENQTPPEQTLTCFILMFDVFYKQLEVQEIEKHKGVVGPVSIPFLTLMKGMLQSPCLAPHICAGDKDCTTCDLTITYFQLTMDILAYLLPLLAIQNNRVADMIPPEPDSSQLTKSEPSQERNNDEDDKDSPGSATEKVEASNEHATNMPQIVTATVETVGELDIVANMPQEQVVAAMATAVMLTEEDVAGDKAHATASVDRASVVGANDEPIDCTKPIDAEEENSFWVTSQGKFKFKLEQLPPHLQVIYSLLLLLEKAEDGDVVYHLCECLRYLILHGESFAQAASDHRGFLIYCQEKKDIVLMWSLLEAEWSHVAEICVALLLHFLTLPCGADIFWKLCENHFHHADWRVRFQAVEKVVVIGRFLTVASVKQCPGLQAAIAHAFCFLLASLDDIYVAVAQRAHLYLTSLPDSGLRALSWCLEQQFDSVILDRPMIIQALHQLSSLLPERKILSWEFFYNRFDALYLEAQIALEKHGEIAFPRDLRNSDMTSDIFARKLSRAQDALSLVQNASAKTLSSSLGTKWPYKRTMSAPANIFNRTDKQADGGMRVFDDGTMVHQLQKAMELEETDNDTFHLLIFLLMHFLSQPQQTGNSEDKGSAKVMNFVLRHLSVLMGFSPQEKSFTISPARLRASPVFNAFLSNLPQVFDHNFNMGKVLLPTCLPVLQFCPSPHRMIDLRHPNFSLWCLQPHPRRWWLTSVLTIMYKFDYTQQPLCSQIVSLIRIVLMTLENHFHRCRKVTETGICATNLSYSREQSQGSLGGQEAPSGDTGHEITPPQSPNAPSTGGRSIGPTTSGTQDGQKGSLSSDHKSAFTPLGDQKNGGEKDKGLFAIPESPKLESQDGVLEILPYDEVVKGAQALVKIEGQETTKARFSVVTAASTSAVIPQTVTVVTTPRGVTSVMASQIQAFHDSFTVKIHDAELVQPFASLDLSSEVSESISLDDNNQSWSTDLDQFPHLSGSDFSLESACCMPTPVSLYQLHVQGRESVRTTDEVTPSRFIFRPIVTHGTSCVEPHPASPVCTGTGSKDSALVRSPTAIHIAKAQTPEVITSPTVQAQMDESKTIQIQSVEARPVEPRIMRIQSTDSSTQQGRHFSPQSPLSMMDLITLGSPVEVDVSEMSVALPSPSPSVEVSSPKALELPTPERLLQVGGEHGSQERLSDHHEGSQLESVEKVWQSFEGWTNSSKSSINNGDSSAELREVIIMNDSIKIDRHLSAKEAMKPVRMDQLRNIQTSTDEPSDNSNTITGSGHSSEREVSSKSETNKSSSKSRCWDDIANNYYSWSEPSEGLSTKGGKGSQPPVPPSSSMKQSSLRVGDDCMIFRCMECGESLEEFSNGDLGLCIIILSTFVHREAGLAAPLLPRMLKTVSRVAGSEVFTWQFESPIHLPGSATSIGRQFLRCVLHQLAPNQIFNQIFQIDIPEAHKTRFFKTLSQALTDFNELSPSAPVLLLLENLNSQKCLPTENLGHIIGNVATYMECATLEWNALLSSSLLPLFDTFLRKVLLNVHCLQSLDFLMKLLINVFRVQGVSSHKNILDPVSKLLSFSIQNGPLKFEHLCEICYLCNRIFPRERDKLLLSRMVVFEFVQALKFKTMIPDTNMVVLIQLILQDSGGTLGSNTVLEGLPQAILEGQSQHNTCVAECMRSHLHDSLEFIADVHTITKVKSTCRSTVGLNEDTLGGLIKAGVAQYLALEITRGNSRDSRMIAKYLPWLQSAPTAVQQGPKEFIECVVHIRLLSWLLLGSLTHTCLVGPSSSIQCQPVPPEASCHIADHIQVILAGFPEHSKNTVQHMSSLYQTFILSQLWTLYLEQGAGSPASEFHTSICAILTDFWAKITPAILQLVSHSKVLGEMVALHLMSLMEALQECQSSVLTKLIPLWAPVLYTQHAKMPGQLLVRLRACQDSSPPSVDKNPPPTGSLGQPTSVALPSLSRWLHRLQFKMGQIEMQSSAAIQFYSV